jgi:hypothetical protein
MEYRRNTLYDDEEQQMTTSSFSYYESIEEFNDYRYNGTSYSYYNIWLHLLNLICCKRKRNQTDD